MTWARIEFKPKKSRFMVIKRASYRQIHIERAKPNDTINRTEPIEMSREMVSGIPLETTETRRTSRPTDSGWQIHILNIPEWYSVQIDGSDDAVQNTNI